MGETEMGERNETERVSFEGVDGKFGLAPGQKAFPDRMHYVPCIPRPGGDFLDMYKNATGDTDLKKVWCAGSLPLGREWAIQKRASESTQNFHGLGFSCCPVRSCLLVCE